MDASVPWLGSSPAKNGNKARTNGTMSCGPRLVSQLPSCTTARSSQTAPAWTMSSRTPGHDVIVRPEASPADANSHGPWQSVAMGLPEASKSLTNWRAVADWRNRSGLMKPPGISKAS
ncbi:hypothetical protein GCM10007320_30390 [Pseudorhodoferax aquiterrae]|uniref:Uncharacterized protein n=1 Tax=Pseudorhodoferax aquiterrae TaxID=747304 RepID=A0ABQ3G3J5_9BURK|nr:hypothetical protein GCM10007320_30390 [Pseudorhodoferax aquiterrae]